MTSIEDIIVDLKNVSTIIGKIPSSKDYAKHGKYHRSTIERKCGSWNEGLLKAFGIVNQVRGPSKPTILCKNCDKPTRNKRFCSHSCAASATNVGVCRYSRKNIKICSCGKQVNRLAKGDKCRDCRDKQRVEEFGKKLLSECTSTYARHRYQSVRHHAHRVARINGMEKKCTALTCDGTICGYIKHVELCHRKSIANFLPNSTLSEINDLANIIYLCPTHHWELDNGGLNLP